MCSRELLIEFKKRVIKELVQEHSCEEERVKKIINKVYKEMKERIEK
jgi:hypothetical protein